MRQFSAIGAAIVRFAASQGSEDDSSELLGSDMRSPTSSVSVGTRDWRHVTE